MRRGVTILEVLISIVVLTTMVAAIFPTIGWLITRSKQLQYDSQASTIMAEGVEVAYHVFLGDWLGVGVGTYHPAVSPGEADGSWMWVLEPGELVVATRFTRSVVVEGVCRDEDDGGRTAILSGGGTCPDGSTIDPASKLVRSIVKWKERGVDREIKAELLVIRI